jgi:hypothetical protein
MDKKGLVGLVVVVGVLLVVGLVWFISNLGESVEGCVPASCCHASECIWESEAPNCSMVACTLSCEPGTMDCGQGKCKVVDGECEVVWNE